MADFKNCPADPEEVAEAYVMERLTAQQAEQFEAHYVICPECATIVQETALYVDAMRAAAARFNSDTPRTAGAGSY